MDGFTFNGIHSETYSVYYIPDAADRWLQDPEYDVYDIDVAWRHGGYHYGETVKKRKIEVKCYFECIDRKTREKIRKWLRRDAYGQLIFDERPFVYYNVHVNKVVPGKQYIDTDGTYSGTFTITFMAYEPFGYMTRKSNTGGEDDGAEDYCTIIDAGSMPDTPGTGDRTFMVYNPGTEPCGMTLRVSGTASNPIMFLNELNDTRCIISAFPTNNLILDIDGETGYIKTYMAQAPANYSDGFAYHDHGIVRLEPNESFEDVTYTYLGENGTYQRFHVEGMDVTKDLEGGRIMFDNQEFIVARIQHAYPDINCVDCLVASAWKTVRSYTWGEMLELTWGDLKGSEIPESGTCKVSTVNDIQILEYSEANHNWTAPSTLTLNSIEIDYAPRVL